MKINCWVLLLMLTVASWGRAETDWDLYLEVAGIHDVIIQTNALIDQEVQHLTKAPLGLTAGSLQQIRQQLHDYVGAEALRSAIIHQLNHQFSEEQLLALQGLLESKFIVDLQSRQALLLDASVQRDIRAYGLKLARGNPNAQRVALFASLDQRLQQSTIEAEIRIELRKHLLAQVSKLKADERISEAMLDDQLLAYRAELADKLHQDARLAYMYLYKQTPSHQLRDGLAMLDQPVYSHLIDICQQTIRASFQTARRQLYAEPRLAGN